MYQKVITMTNIRHQRRLSLSAYLAFLMLSDRSLPPPALGTPSASLHQALIFRLFQLLWKISTVVQQ